VSWAIAGVTRMETSVAELTFSGAEPVAPLKIALIFAVPEPMPVAPPELPIVATAGLSDAQLTSVVMTCVLESLNRPVAVKASLVPGAIARPVGVTEIDRIVASLTSRVTELVAGPSVTVIIVVPGLRLFATPLAEPIVATVVFEEVHAT